LGYDNGRIFRNRLRAWDQSDPMLGGDRRLRNESMIPDRLPGGDGDGPFQPPGEPTADIGSPSPLFYLGRLSGLEQGGSFSALFEMPSLRCSASLEQTTEEKLYITFYSDPAAGHFDQPLRQNNEGFCRWCVGGFRYNHLRMRYGTNQLRISRDPAKKIQRSIEKS